MVCPLPEPASDIAMARVVVTSTVVGVIQAGGGMVMVVNGAIVTLVAVVTLVDVTEVLVPVLLTNVVVSQPSDSA